MSLTYRFKNIPSKPHSIKGDGKKEGVVFLIIHWTLLPTLNDEYQFLEQFAWCLFPKPLISKCQK